MYNVTNGDYFVVDEKSQQQLRISTGSPRSQGMVFGSPSPRATSCSISPANGNGTRLRRKSSESSAHAPPSPVGLQPCHRKSSSGRTSPATHGCGGRKTSSDPSRIQLLSITESSFTAKCFLTQRRIDCVI